MNEDLGIEIKRAKESRQIAESIADDVEWDEYDKALSRIADLEAENEQLKTRIETAGDDVMQIIAAALSGDYQKYLNYDFDGNRYCKWGIVEKDIRAIFEKGGEL